MSSPALAGRAADEQDLSTVHIDICVEERNFMGSRGLLHISKHLIDGCRDHLCAFLGQQSVGSVEA